MNSNTHTTAAAPTPDTDRWFLKHLGDSTFDRMMFFEDQLRCTWLALNAEPGFIGNDEILTVRNVIDMVREGIGELRMEIERQKYREAGL